MDIFETFEDYLAQSRAQIPVLWFILNLIFTGILSLILKWVYVLYGNTLSNRKLFGKNLLMISMTTMLIITIVKSSLALSLGLVGALSIIRFRTAVKEPEELAYLFLAISIGLGFGANQGNITVIAFILILSMIVISKRLSSSHKENSILNLIIMSQKPSTLDLDKILDTLNEYCSSIALKRLDETKEMFEVALFVEFVNYEKLIETKKALQKLDQELKITYLDNSNINIG